MPKLTFYRSSVLILLFSLMITNSIFAQIKYTKQESEKGKKPPKNSKRNQSQDHLSSLSNLQQRYEKTNYSIYLVNTFLYRINQRIPELQKLDSIPIKEKNALQRFSEYVNDYKKILFIHIYLGIPNGVNQVDSTIPYMGYKTVNDRTGGIEFIPGKPDEIEAFATFCDRIMAGFEKLDIAEISFDKKLVTIVKAWDLIEDVQKHPNITQLDKNLLADKFISYVDTNPKQDLATLEKKNKPLYVAVSLLAGKKEYNDNEFDSLVNSSPNIKRDLLDGQSTYLDTTISIAKTLKKDEIVANTLILKGNLYTSDGEREKALINYNGALTNLNKGTKKAGIYYKIGDIQLENSSYNDATKSYLDALALYKEENDLPGQKRALAKLGMAYTAVGNEEQAKKTFEEIKRLSLPPNPPPPPFTQNGFDIDFQNTSSYNYGLFVNNFNVIGDVKFTSVLRLNELKAGSSGAVWFIKKQKLISGFSTTFDFAIDDRDGNGADGFAFVIQNKSLSVIGEGGGGLGYGGIPNSIAIEFDTYPNIEKNDPQNPHISIQVAGTTQTHHRGAPTFAHPELKNRIHRATITYYNQKLSIYIDDVRIIVTELSMQILEKIINGDEAYVGFTASTGALYQNHLIFRWKFKSSNQ